MPGPGIHNDRVRNIRFLKCAKAVLINLSFPENLSFVILKPYLGKNRYFLGAVNSFDGYCAVLVVISKDY
jgi:hypothetical protein